MCTPGISRLLRLGYLLYTFDNFTREEIRGLGFLLGCTPVSILLETAELRQSSFDSDSITTISKGVINR